MQMTKQLICVLRDEMNAALAAVAAKHGVKVFAGQARYDASRVTYALEVTLPDASGDVDAKDKQDLEKLAGFFGCARAQHDVQFVHKGVPYRVKGISPKRPKYAFICEEVHSGKRAFFPAALLNQLIPVQ